MSRQKSIFLSTVGKQLTEGKAAVGQNIRLTQGECQARREAITRILALVSSHSVSSCESGISPPPA